MPLKADDLYQRAKDVFLEVCDAPADQRAAVLDRLCGDDSALRAEVEALLGHDLSEDGLDVPGTRAPGDRVGRYTIRRVLGAGSMGVVYEAEDDRPRRLVALKIGRAGMNAASLRRRLSLEASALGRLQHPGIAAVYGSGVDEATGEPYFAMELVRGRPVTEHAAGLSLRDRVALIAEVCDAVHHAHLRGVIHRDLKPSNILVDESGRARVLDFGIARITDAGEDGAVTVPGQVIGTLAYMSPEQAAGDPDAIDARTDVYALGSVLYEVLAGRPPLDLGGASVVTALRDIQEREPARLGSLDRRLRGDPEAITAKALEKDAARRYQSAEALAADLRRLLHGEPIAARPATTLYQLGKFARRRRGLVAAAGVAAVALVAATTVSAAFAVRAEAERARAERRFAELRGLANTLLFDIHDRVERLAGSVEARREIVRTGLNYLDSLAAEAGDDPELLDELAKAYARIGAIQGNPFASNLGDTDAALASFARSIEIREQIERLTPGTLGNRLALARTRISVADVATSAARAQDALDHYEQAAAMLEAMPDTELAVLDTLSFVYGRLGHTLRNMGRNEEALERFLLSLGFAERIMERDPESKDYRSVGVALNEAGQTLIRLGRPGEAREYLERAMRIRAEAAANEPHDARAQRDLALAHHRLADVYQAEDKLESTLGHNRAALELLAALHAAAPTDARACLDESIALDKLGTTLRMLGRHEEALAMHRRVCELRDKLAEAQPDNMFYVMVQAAAFDQVAETLMMMGRHDEAREAFAAAVEASERGTRSGDNDTRLWSTLAHAQRGMADSLLADAAADPAGGAERRARAGEWLRACMDTLARMEERGIVPVRTDMNRAAIAALLAECENAAGG